jgi:CDP-diacylglycerol--serine O-phosphatidyltransferase
MIHFFFSHSDDPAAGNRRLQGAKLLPNILTIAALCIGLTALQSAIETRFTNAMMLILVAAVLDGMDGMVARLLKASSPFGAELDSFSDFVSFGIAPAILLYLWNLSNGGPFGWVVALLLSVAVALRLARFNVKNITAPQNAPPDNAAKKAFFEGVPAPAGAILALVPVMLGLKIYPEDDQIFPFIPVALWVLLIAALMVSRIPTYSLKRMSLSQKHTIPVLAGVALYAAALASEPWATLILSCLAYLATIPHSYKRYNLLYGNPVANQAVPQVNGDDSKAA